MLFRIWVYIYTLFSVGMADIVCFTPHLDTTRITALNASSILHEIVTIIADRVSKNNPKK